MLLSASAVLDVAGWFVYFVTPLRTSHERTFRQITSNSMANPPRKQKLRGLSWAMIRLRPLFGYLKSVTFETCQWCAPVDYCWKVPKPWWEVPSDSDRWRRLNQAVSSSHRVTDTFKILQCVIAAIRVERSEFALRRDATCPSALSSFEGRFIRSVLIGYSGLLCTKGWLCCRSKAL